MIVESFSLAKFLISPDLISWASIPKSIINVIEIARKPGKKASCSAYTPQSEQLLCENIGNFLTRSKNVKNTFNQGNNMNSLNLLSIWR